MGAQINHIKKIEINHNQTSTSRMPHKKPTYAERQSQALEKVLKPLRDSLNKIDKAIKSKSDDWDTWNWATMDVYNELHKLLEKNKKGSEKIKILMAHAIMLKSKAALTLR